ncbi:hypothetical protein [Limnoglobus roseus]|uniref:Uncharacterized protein n=1 Tax=Limnoglobus roseus TaxID=2598579 RepID=A0A5C1AJE4_9BACT|nr:hypothetical protein [Limnoglobus roseus]QEL17254.1 hypothetical protein PX52LOC_04237 [Limnoglobus roseus]
MRIFKIKSGPHKDKQIHVTKYIKRARGVDINIEHNVPTVSGKSLQWVQTVSDNGTFFKDCKLNPHVDPYGKGGAVNTVSLPGFPGSCKADDLLPFFWTTAELAIVGSRFSDKPSEAVPKSGRTWTIFITALTEVTNKAVQHLVYINWGYDLMADGSVRVAAIVTPTDDQIKAHLQTLRKMYPTFTYT